MSRSEIHTLQFDSPVDAARFAKTTPRVPKSQRESDKNKDGDWALGLDLAETLDKVESGYIWNQGLDAMTASMEVTDELAAKSSLPRLVRAVSGGVPCVGAHVMGHPKAMYRKQKRDTVDRPVLSVGINTGLAWSVTSKQRLNFAAAMLSAVDQLERVGYRVELTALWRAADSGECSDYSKWTNIEVMLKRASERWNPTTIAFVVGHPAVQRRMYWRILETQEQWRHLTDGYCYHADSIHYDRSMAMDFDIYFGNMASAIAKKCNTPEGAFAYVESVVNSMLADQKAAVSRG